MWLENTVGESWMTDVNVDARALEELLQAGFADCQVRVDGGGGKYQVVMVGDAFAGLNAVKRQQLVYQHLNMYIRSGAVHAVSMHLTTPEESATA
jgi:acid stress-induced BolA-like protein IbaG/YrbA